jgi:hypothetical protein
MKRKRKPNNPAKFDRCVKKVKAKGSAADPYAVCTAAGTRKPRSRRKAAKQKNLVPLFTAAGEFAGNVQSAKAAQKFIKTGKFNKGRKRANPATEAAEAFEEFHGRPSEETVTVQKQVHYHRHLAAAGKLEKLVVICRLGYRITLSKFKGAMLCFSEKWHETGYGPQLFIEGGDQSVDLKQFGISRPHETETLGDLVQVDYFTTKDHLGSDGGTAIYQHKFLKPYPHLVYDVANQQLIFSGGKYVILPEGIDK